MAVGDATPAPAPAPGSGDDKTLNDEKAGDLTVIVDSVKKEATSDTNDLPSDESPDVVLTEEETKIIERQLDLPTVKVTFSTLYRYATRNDRIILAVSTLCCIAGGAGLPLMTLILGSFAGSFQAIFYGTITQDQFNSDLTYYSLLFVYLAIARFVTIYIATWGFIYTGEHVSAKIREQYLAALMRQNMAFYDKHGVGEITTRITHDMNLVQDGMSEMLAFVLTLFATFVTSLVVGFVQYWKLTLILMSGVLATVLVMALGSRFFVTATIKGLQATGVGGSKAEEALASIRNAAAFGTQEKLVARYQKHLGEAEKWGIRVKIALGCLIGGMLGAQYLTYGLGVWLGGRYIVEGETTLPRIIAIMMALTLGASTLGTLATPAQTIATSISAASKIFQVIDRASPLDPSSDAGMVPPVLIGHIELRNVTHVYPSRRKRLAMDKVSINIAAGKMTALVGASGSGKSSIIGLLERFYEPIQGSITLDGHDIKDLSLRWLRQQMSLVIQEPVLFSATIRENIAHGLRGTEWEAAQDKDELIYQAAKAANAHDFIQSLPNGYDTLVSHQASLLSGGQKQRVAIARAIVGNPKILLLDEATSALDTRSEGEVQTALDRSSKGRTTIVIAHRLSTIKNADHIVVMDRGRVVEQGTHDELVASKGHYFKLVEAQSLRQEAESRVGASGAQEDTESEDTDAGAATSMIPKSTVADATDTDLVIPSDAGHGKAIEKEPKYFSLVKLMASFNKAEARVILVGLVLAVIVGGGNPTQAIFLAKSINALSFPPSLYDELGRQAGFWALMYLMLAFVVFLAYVAQGWAFSYCSERLIYKVRVAALRAMLRQDISFFDRHENSSGALTAFLSTETNHLAGLSGSTLGTLLTLTTTLVAALSLSLAIGWKLALVCGSTMPVVLACGFLRYHILQKLQARKQKAYAESAAYASEMTSSIRTVASLTREKDILAHYHDMMKAQVKSSTVAVIKSSVLYAASQSVTFLAMALGFWYGGGKVAAREYDLFQFFACFGAIIFGAEAAGTLFSLTPDMAKATSAANELKDLLDKRPSIDTWSKEGLHADSSTVQGKMELKDVHFSYSTRPDHKVLRGLSLTVLPGQYVAIVGSSGCGKSTVIQLLERFYDPSSGTVELDGRDIISYNVNSYRSLLSLVSQEPTLYHGSIRENLLLGTPDEEVSDDLLWNALHEANLGDFVSSLPDGLNTDVGPKGSLLSGGQKQRVALARALIRNPRVLLLDEATSALDSESERVVQAALDAAAKGRTTIAVAHRLSSIQNADRIYFLDQGRVAEQGTHEELLALRGRYWGYAALQSLENVGA
ncbi:P-loop containing nucleoside triphosphate hydrolase protein [Rhypophila decipiens]|uniref:P-loop containing nucleoside triphosphate hydrolase protein n=1 Tax=Rhypophila decipiens TaxID=261697 RepID=A0AAN6Y3S3_9PEZI|nr:P-loop containing nucleoside triphosphate hydrolase protein [Rhypophila decipiens]